MNKSAYTISDIARILEVEGSFSPCSIDALLLDSRLYLGNLHSLFFAIKSKKNDGHNYIPHLYDRGLRNFVVSAEFDSTPFPEGNFLRVADPLFALQKLASIHRDAFEIPVIGITGSNGKTIVKEWLFQLLHSNFDIIRSPRSYNSQVGVPLSLWQIKPKHQMAIIECGISEKGEMSKLAEIVSPTIGIFTNIGEAHQENFSSLAKKAAEKAKLFQNCEVVISCYDHTIVQEALSGFRIKKKLTWGGKGADLEITQVNQSKEKTELEGNFDGQKSSITFPFIDEASIENACHCWLICLLLNLSAKEISHRMAALSPVAMRLEKRAGIHHSTIINDSYNSDLTSLNIALDFLKMQSKGQEQVLILSDILQTTEKPELLYPAIAKNIAERNVTKFIGIGRDLSAFKNSFQDINSTFYISTQEFLIDFDTRQLEHKSILIKGARHFKFEKIVDRFEQKSHETIMEIDLNKMVDNLDYIKGLLKPSTKIMAMVKASAYGSGSAEIAATLQFNGVEYLAVAYADEGISLRESGITLPILVLNPSSAAYDAMIRRDLEPQLYSFQTLRNFLELLKIHSEKTPFPVHIKMNTGMNRLGFDEEDIAELAETLKSNSHLITVKSVFSHLAASDAKEFDSFSKNQITVFLRHCNHLKELGVQSFLKHILNSNGIMRHPYGQLDMVRLGLGLYGLSSNEKFRNNLKPIARLKTTLSQIRKVARDEGIGYSPNERTEADKRIGIIAIGYADGIPRLLGNKNGHVIVKGQKAPFLGNICMDMSMIDITGIECIEGDEVEIFGQQNSIYDLATSAKTIPYEILTNVSNRVKRVFFKE